MIRAENLVKRFGSKLAVDDVSFEVDRGEVLGFLGPNGAGKSTTMRMLTGFLTPTSGRVEIQSHDMESEGIQARATIGYLPENAPAYEEMTVRAFLRFAAELNGLRGQERDTAVERAVDLCFLQSVFYQPIGTLSKGFRHRTCFAQALIHDPPVLILDEPTDGLDPNQKHEVRNLIKRMGETKAIIISTHILEEVDAVCSRVIIIDEGKLVFNGQPEELRSRSKRCGAVCVRILGEGTDAARELLQTIDGVSQVLVTREDHHDVLFEISGDHGRAGLAGRVGDALRERNLRFDELHTLQGRLDDVFRSITKADVRKEKAA